MKRFALISMAVVCGFGLVGCEKEKPPVTPDQVLEAAPEKKTPDAKEDGKDDDANKANASVDDQIAKMCELPEARFDFDSSSVSGDARKVVGLIASCFLTGPGKGKSINVVGHADSRGEEEYNLALGQRRSGSMASLFQQAGLGEDRVNSSSRGELDATGTDASGWSRDRRVEILLAK